MYTRQNWQAKVQPNITDTLQAGINSIKLLQLLFTSVSTAVNYTCKSFIELNPVHLEEKVEQPRGAPEWN